MSPAPQEGGQGGCRWRAPVFLVFPCGVMPWKGAPPRQELPPPCLLPEIKSLLSAVDVLLWVSPGTATGAGLFFAATRMSLSPVTHGLAKCRSSLRGCGKRWWCWGHRTKQAGPCALQSEAAQPLGMTVEMLPGSSARCLWAALAPTHLSRWGREDPACLLVAGGESGAKAAVWHGGSCISLALIKV